MNYTEKIIKTLTILGFTSDNRHMLKTSGKINGEGFNVFYSAKIDGQFYSALLGYDKAYDDTYYIDSFNMSNGSLDYFIDYASFSSPSSSEEIYHKLYDIFKYELRKIKLNKLLS